MFSLLCTQNYKITDCTCKGGSKKYILSCLQMAQNYKIRKQNKYLGLVKHHSKLL